MKSQKGADNKPLFASQKHKWSFNRIMPRNKLILFVNLESNNQSVSILIILKLLLTKI
jgi:hypothetical protein